MRLQDDPVTENEQAIVDALFDTLEEKDPGRSSMYPEDHVYFNTKDASENCIALFKVEFWPEIPETEFGPGKSALMMQEEFEQALRDNLPSHLKFDRKTSHQLEFYEER